MSSAYFQAWDVKRPPPGDCNTIFGKGVYNSGVGAVQGAAGLIDLLTFGLTNLHGENKDWETRMASKEMTMVVPKEWSDKYGRMENKEVHLSDNAGYKITEQQKAMNKIKSSVRCRVEHVFGAMKIRMGNEILRSIGFARAKFWLCFFEWGEMRNLMYNMGRFVSLMRPKKVPKPVKVR